MISHDMGVVAEMADRVAVMFNGRIVETGPVAQIFDAPEHPFTRKLLAARQHRRRKHKTPKASKPIIEAKGLIRHYPNPRRKLFERRGETVAVDNVDITIGQNEIVGLIGESGSGKSTIGRLLLGLETPDAGTVAIDGRPMPTLEKGRPVVVAYVDNVHGVCYDVEDGRILAQALASVFVRYGLRYRVEVDGERLLRSGRLLRG